MLNLPPGYEIRGGFESTRFDQVHGMLVKAYWCRGTTRERIEKSAQGSSLVVNVFHGETQVAFARIVSDFTTFGWICDVIVHDEHQGKGLGRAMVRYAMTHPQHQGFRRWVLATKDAHGVYAALGFEPVDQPENWMVFLPSDAPERAIGKDVV